MKALVLGGSGFIGSHIVDRLLLDGHSVRVFGRRSEACRDSLIEVEYVVSSFDNKQALSEALDGIDIVYHLISSTIPSTSNDQPVFDITSNLVNTVHLLDLMRDSGVQRIVYLSSGGTVYGTPEVIPIPEGHGLKPLCSYGVVKVAVENYLFMYQKLYNIEPLILRVSNPYGERQSGIHSQGVIGAFMKKTIADIGLEVWGDGHVVRDFIYVKDLADLCVLAGRSRKTGIYNAGSGSGHSIRDIISLIETVTGKSLKTQFKTGRPYDVPVSVLNIDKARSDFDWNPTTGLEVGMSETWKWFLLEPQ